MDINTILNASPEEIKQMNRRLERQILVRALTFVLFKTAILVAIRFALRKR